MRYAGGMVDNFSIGLTHLLLAIAMWRLLYRDDLDHEVSPRMLWQRRQDEDTQRDQGDA